ncbi:MULTISPECIES: RNA polymerase sigma factor [Methylobacterium]|uniref:RNA polymerase sigma factor FecI n=1 Tax=Methylobacterium jeotgali TaxID=381630 RepID=A0ABQ4SZC8_9HYPH|nr:MULTISPECIES: RNA polymerase sigma factor [Methylobacterium]PIU07980.1 MAG: RNA polymerase subunit sigma-70 [Methylobacterium sp. CG09_land_8_20_14_0_10_71_15]PIU15774.1 MAG: RNA polymerase subunit sigma-70 [Methylobacterium sp. CG08_land_8_20_14_0_20_71_15]GBU17905.1 DNA-directed RNA polymerase sigma-70 factor [Methylobacterium sp.]GJE08565.1 putative RNA polymerase sigma factor FecI [Methylobacterium jeotgali]
MASHLEAAYLRHSPDLVRYVRRRIADDHSSADLVHDAFLRVAEQPLAAVQDIRAYLFQVARNLLLDQRKQAARRRTLVVAPETLAEVVDEAPSPEDAADARLRLDRLRGTVGELPFRTQQIFVLNRIDGLGYAEVARHLGISQSAVQKHLAMAVRHIAERSRPRR